jgi:para-aminobenzoate synthetase/4-amino-4-deoxychorismate lyase
VVGTVILDFPGVGLRRFAEAREVLVASSREDIRRVLDAVDEATHAGLHAVGFLSYDGASLPFAWFGLFDAPTAIDESTLPEAGTPALWTPDVTHAAYDAAVAEIREGIGRGDYYQLNYTFRMRARDVDPLALFHRLRRAQPGAHCAYFDLGPHAIVSASPELFFSRDGRRIVTRPMKGTAPRGRWCDEDDALAHALATSEKERAENLMIVDLVRNDLGRVAKLGSVNVTRLCDVERWPTVLQMTSTVEAQVRPDITTSDIFDALFPCGSVTGAPKLSATQAIARLERSPRGIYCGAIGYIEPGGLATFSVAIRTACIDRETGIAEYGVGGGITWDSCASSEYDEAVTKARVLTVDTPSFELVETMRLDDGQYVRLERHLARLSRSAQYFGFARSADAVRLALADVARPGVWRVRLLVSRSGGFRIEIGDMPKPSNEPLRIGLASTPVTSSDPFLFHKTTHRSIYPEALELLRNERGELTEFTIGNLVLEIDGHRWTPPISAGLLGGVFREELLERGEIAERILHVEDLARASRVWMINSLREWVAVLVLQSSDAQ